MSYTYSITSKGQITIPKEYMDKLGLNEFKSVTIVLKNGEIVLTKPKSFEEVRKALSKPSFKDPLTPTEKIISASFSSKVR